MALSEIKKYFHLGIRELLSEDYFMVGLIMGKAPCIYFFFIWKLTICHCVTSKVVVFFFQNEYTLLKFILLYLR